LPLFSLDSHITYSQSHVWFSIVWNVASCTVVNFGGILLGPAYAFSATLASGFVLKWDRNGTTYDLEATWTGNNW
jgi:predicted membrane protein